jgi:molybdenum cofactor cytidylyltransferase
MSTTGIVILAAGASTRLGKPKQLLPWQGSTLLQHAVQVAGQVTHQPVVVLGAHWHQLEAVLDRATVQIVHNPSWKEGLASSIRSGLTAALGQQTAPGQVIFMVCDQPFVSAALLQELVLAHQKTGKSIIASAYAGTVGIPALFNATFFPQLLDLEGDTGAKKIMQEHSEQVYAVPFPMGHIDIDTAEEYDALVR